MKTNWHQGTTNFKGGKPTKADAIKKALAEGVIYPAHLRNATEVVFDEMTQLDKDQIPKVVGYCVQITQYDEVPDAPTAKEVLEDRTV